MHRRSFPSLLCAFAALSLVFAQRDAQAQPAPQPAPVWRCGNAYSHQPCEHGAAVDTQDARTAEQQGQARAQAQQTRAFADTLHRENAAREARQREEEIARQRALLREQAARQRAQKKAQAAQNMAARHKLRHRRLAKSRRVVKPLPGQPAPAPQR